MPLGDKPHVAKRFPGLAQELHGFVRRYGFNPTALAVCDPRRRLKNERDIPSRLFRDPDYVLPLAAGGSGGQHDFNERFFRRHF